MIDLESNTPADLAVTLIAKLFTRNPNLEAAIGKRRPLGEPDHELKHNAPANRAGGRKIELDPSASRAYQGVWVFIEHERGAGASGVVGADGRRPQAGRQAGRAAVPAW